MAKSWIEHSIPKPNYKTTIDIGYQIKNGRKLLVIDENTKSDGIKQVNKIDFRSPSDVQRFSTYLKSCRTRNVIPNLMIWTKGPRNYYFQSLESCGPNTFLHNSVFKLDIDCPEFNMAHFISFYLKDHKTQTNGNEMMFIDCMIDLLDKY